MTDLVEFLLARIGDDQERARECAKVYPPPWDMYDRGHSAKVQADGPHFRVVVDLDQDQVAVGEVEWLGDPIEHVARWNPARVLAECEAKRRIVELHVIGGSLRGPETDNKFYTCELCGPNDWPLHKVDGRWVDVPEPGGDFWPCETLRLLALPYADRPGYREEWRP